MLKPTLDSILDALNSNHQRATYGAVAAVVGGLARSVMTGRPKDWRHSWVVSAQTALPSQCSPQQMHPRLRANSLILSTGDALREWLDAAERDGRS